MTADDSPFTSVSGDDIAKLDTGQPPPPGHPERAEDRRDGDEDGGVREPRRPVGPQPSDAAALPEPDDV